MQLPLLLRSSAAHAPSLNEEVTVDDEATTEERSFHEAQDDRGAVHQPVMVDRVVALLAAQGPGVLVDATVGAGGHAAALMAASGEDVHLVGFDLDPDALGLADRRLAAYRSRTHLIHAAYDRFAEHVEPVVAHAGPLLGVLYDLGVSSLQLDRPERGFSFRFDAPLDMRMDTTRGETAADLVNNLDVSELARILATYGEERAAGRIARAIVRSRPILTTAELLETVGQTLPARRGPGIHPATRTFQALRIAVNHELERFGASLPQALELAAPAMAADTAARGGRIAVLSYHSLEDRIAKATFSAASTGCICPPDLPVCGCGRQPYVRALIRGIERPEAAEIAANPRARSAKLRAVEKVAVAPT
ncbi:MAG: 16S rRNA (cytosine(1402)-N(4))-methyltransferase RsmH [Egibacteraceae bacterium]